MPTDAERLKAGRKSLGLTLHEMGIALGYSESKWLRGKIQKMEAGKLPIPAHRMRILELLLKRS